MNWGLIVVGAIAAIIVLAILLKICEKFIYVQLVFETLSAIAVIVTGFAMPESSNGSINWDWVLGQGISIFAFCVFFAAGIAFDKEEYVEREVRETWDDKLEVTDRLKTRGLFWSTLGGSLVAGILFPVINYFIFGDNGIAIGIIGCIALIWSVVWIIKFLKLDFGKRGGGPKDYY